MLLLYFTQQPVRRTRRRRAENSIKVQWQQQRAVIDFDANGYCYLNNLQAQLLLNCTVLTYTRKLLMRIYEQKAAAVK